MLNVSTVPTASVLILGNHTTDVQVRGRWRLISKNVGNLAFLRAVAINTDVFWDVIQNGLE
jgi:hypothetical protein